MTLINKKLIGQDESHLVDYKNFKIEKETLSAFLKLQKLALKEDIELEIVSAYRSFERQLTIWNEKILGKRAVLDDHEQPVNMAELDDHDKVEMILKWSALPGTSRHHWGSDIDVFDKKAQTTHLTVKEWSDDGPMHRLNQWLTPLIENELSYGFIRPYDGLLGGVNVEPWHLSYSPVARKFEHLFTIELFESFLKESNILLKEVIINDISYFYQRFFK